MITSIPGILATNRIFIDATSNVFLGTVSNLWSNPANWSYGHVPTNTERARIHNGCVLDINGVCDELQIDSGYTLGHASATWTLTMSSILNYGTWNCTGSFSMIGDNTRNTTWGVVVFGNTGTANFNNPNNTTLTIPSLDYYNFLSDNYGTRNLNTSTTIRNTLSTNKGFLVISGNLIVNGATNYAGENNGLQFSGCTVTFNGAVSTSNRDSIRFTNTVIYANESFQFGGCSYSNFFYGSNTMYLKKGLAVSCGTNYAGSIDATGTDLIFRTNNQNIDTFGITAKSITIEGDITVSNVKGHIRTSSLNGTASASTLINRAITYYTGSTTPMSTGILDCSAYSNTFNYTSVNDLTLKSVDYWHLNLGSTSASTENTKSITVDTLIKGHFSLLGKCNFDYSGSVVTINGTYISTSANPIGWVRGSFKSTGDSTLVFKGSVTLANPHFSLVTGTNNIVEFQNGGVFDGYPAFSFSTLVKFTTNNQTVSNAGTSTFTTPNLIIDNITLTTTGAHVNAGMIFTDVTGVGNAVINGAGTSWNRIYGGISNVSITTSVTAFQTSYDKLGTQDVAPGIYGGLTISGGLKTLVGGSIQVLGNLYIPNGGIEFGSNDVALNTMNLRTLFRKSGAGNIIFNGLINIVNNSTFDISGATNIKFKNGWTGDSSSFNSGTGHITFEGTQTLNMNYKNWIFNNPILISNNSIVTVLGGPANRLTITNSFNGENSASEFRLATDSNFIISASNPNVMTIGLFNYLYSIASTLGYGGNYSYSLPYTQFKGLYIEGAGTKTLSGNTIVDGSLTMPRSFAIILDCLDHDLTVKGTTLNVGGIKKHQPGTICFYQSYNGYNSGFNFSGPSIIVEFRGGTNGDGSYSLLGAFTKCTTNNQTHSVPATYVEHKYGDILIDDDIVITFSGTGRSTIWGILNGSNANSKLITSTNIRYNNQTEPMLVGMLDTSTYSNYFEYFRDGNQNVKGGNYRSLNLSGTGSPNQKILQGDTTVLDLYRINWNSGVYNAVRIDNGFTFSKP